jgi:hypothetical protein
MDSISALSHIVLDVQADVKDYNEELAFLRNVVYPNVRVMSPKIIGDYAEIAWTVRRSYIRMHGALSVFNTFLEFMAKHICTPYDTHLVALPSIKKHSTKPNKYVVTFLIVSMERMNFVNACQDFGAVTNTEKIVLYANDLMYSLATFDKCYKEFENDFARFAELEEPMYFKVTSDGDITQEAGRIDIDALFDNKKGSGTIT